jgi:hypothetical protein
VSYSAAEPSDGQPHDRHVRVRQLLASPLVAVLVATGVLAAGALAWIDPVLAPHLEGMGFSVGTIGWTFGLLAAIYATVTPGAG